MSQQPTAGQTTIQVSIADLRSLRQRLKDSKFQWTALTNAERWRYHAYDYAFLRVRHGINERRYPLDPDGKWFNESLVQAAERIYQPRKPLYSGEPVRPADTEQDPKRAAHFRCQDAERARLKRQVQVQGERTLSGEPTPEMLAFMACCARQVDENMKRFDRQNRKAFAEEASMSQKEINAAMGVAAAEHKPKPKYMDPEQLLRSRRELGLEE